MSANINDHFTHVAEGTKTELASPGHSIGGTSINVNDASKWVTDTSVYFGIDQQDANGLRIPDTYSEWKGIVSDNSIGSMVLVGGVDQEYTAGSTIRVYMLVTPSWANAIVDGILPQHKQDGAHGAITADSVVTTGDGTIGGNLTVSGPEATLPSSTITPNNLLTGAGTNWDPKSWTPVLQNLTVGNGTLTGQTTQVGRRIYFEYTLQFGTETTLPTGLDTKLSLPTDIDPSYLEYQKVGEFTLVIGSDLLQGTIYYSGDSPTVILNLIKVNAGTGYINTCAVDTDNISVPSGSLLLGSGSYVIPGV